MHLIAVSCQTQNEGRDLCKFQRVEIHMELYEIIMPMDIAIFGPVAATEDLLGDIAACRSLGNMCIHYAFLC